MKGSTEKIPIFFIGGKSRGYKWIREMLSEKENLVGALIMKEDDHEKDKVSEEISKALKKNAIPHFVTKSVKKDKHLNFIRLSKPSLIIVMGWRTLIPKKVIEIARLGTVAVHESLLPKYRGFAPINWAIINGEERTGVTLFFLSEGMDNGDIIAQKKIKITKVDTALSVYNKTEFASLSLLKTFTPLLKKGIAPRKKQKESAATYTCARVPNDGLINWSDSTKNIYNLIRALSEPYPGAFTHLNGQKIIINRASIPKQRKYIGRISGRVVSINKHEGVEVLTGDGILLIKELIKDKRKIDPSRLIKSIKTRLGE